MKLMFKYFFIILFPFILALPLPLIVSSIALSLGLLNILLVNSEKSSSKIKFSKDFLKNSIIITGLLVLLLDLFTAILRNSDFEFIIRESRISFLLIPLVFWLTKDKLEKLRIPLLTSLVIGVLVYIFYAYGYLIHFYANVLSIRGFEFNHYLLYDLRENVPGSYHHTYIGLYMTFSIAILLNYVPKKRQFSFMGLALFIFLNQVLLGSKLTLLLSLFLLVFSVFKFFKQNKIMAVGIFGIFGLVFLLVTILMYKSGVINSLDFSTSNRIESWRCAFQGFLEKPFSGHGNTASIIYIENCITSNAISTHNQYLEELINYGLFGFWLPIYFTFLFLKSKRDVLFRVFMIVIILISCFENTLSLQRGILFFVFFASVFLFQGKKKETRADRTILTSEAFL